MEDVHQWFGEKGLPSIYTFRTIKKAEQKKKKM